MNESFYQDIYIHYRVYSILVYNGSIYDNNKITFFVNFMNIGMHLKLKLKTFHVENK